MHGATTRMYSSIIEIINKKSIYFVGSIYIDLDNVASSLQHKTF